MGRAWRRWADANPALMAELRIRALDASGILSDRFANTAVNQARALADLLNESTPATEIKDPS